MKNFAILFLFSNFLILPSLAWGQVDKSCDARFVSGAGAKLREKKDFVGKVVAVLKFNSKVCLSKWRNEWTQVTTLDSGKSGWIKSDLLGLKEYQESEIIENYNKAVAEIRLADAVNWAERAVDMSESQENLARLAKAVSKTNDSKRAEIIEKKIINVQNSSVAAAELITKTLGPEDLAKISKKYNLETLKLKKSTRKDGIRLEFRFYYPFDNPKSSDEHKVHIVAISGKSERVEYVESIVLGGGGWGLKSEPEVKPEELDSGDFLFNQPGSSFPSLYKVKDRQFTHVDYYVETRPQNIELCLKDTANSGCKQIYNNLLSAQCGDSGDELGMCVVSSLGLSFIKKVQQEKKTKEYFDGELLFSKENVYVFKTKNMSGNINYGPNEDYVLLAFEGDGKPRFQYRYSKIRGSGTGCAKPTYKSGEFIISCSWGDAGDFMSWDIVVDPKRRTKVEKNQKESHEDI
jgi:hypothetical protein